MSDTSDTTVISPPTKTQTRNDSTANLSATSSNAPRRPTTHGAHHVKRRQSSLSHHAHVASTRRTSDGESGRRAAFAGLTMHAMEGAGAGAAPGARRKLSADRPLTKNSKSDPNLPRLSRTASMTSATSHTTSASRPKNGRKRSGASVQVLSADDGSDGQNVDSGDEGWESGEGEGDGDGPEVREERKSKSKSKQPMASVTMQRAASDSQAATARPSPNGASPARITTNGLIDSPLELPTQPANTKRTTGFAGAIHEPDPEVAAQTPHGEILHPYNEANHIMPAHQIKHQQSARSLVALAEADSGSRHARIPSGRAVNAVTGANSTGPGAGVEKSPTQSRVQQLKGEAGLPEPIRMRSTDGSGLPALQPSQSPSFPFPRLHSESGTKEAPPAPSSNQSPSEPGRSVPQTAPQTAAPETEPQTAPQQESNSNSHSDSPSEPTAPSQPRSRQTSAPHPQMRHRYSNSSLRSIQSLRAPPHPLNSPTGYRSVMQPSSRGGSAFNSSSKGKRGPSMHHPPIAPPVVYKEVVNGSGWDGDMELVSELADLNVRATGEMRKPSFSSVRSLRGAMGLPDGPASGSATARTASGSGSMGAPPPPPVRRKTAMEVAAAASKLHTTTDAVAYHHSLGYPSTSAESAHLISRFLPPKRIRRPEWEISPDQARQGYAGRGLTNGDYREAHESLVRSMRELGVDRQPSGTVVGTGNGTGAGTHDGHGHAVNHGEEVGVGLLKGRNGVLVVSRGGWKGRTPFELSVERCLAQRPPPRLAL